MRRAHRKRAQLPPCYYEGFLEKRSLRNRTSRKLWAALCGDALFFFNNSKDCDYVEKQELSNFVSLTDDPSLDRKLDAARLHLRLKEDDIYLTAPSLEACELWKGFILSVVKLQVPTSLNLLPGQVHMLTEVVAKEKERLKEIAEKAAATPDTNHNMPACFYKLARIEAETFLEKHKDKGNMLLRPSRDGTCFAVTTRQELNGPVFQHYRVTRIPDGGFAIAVTNPITCKTLHDVINYLIETTGGTYKPLVLQHTYEENIVYVDYDEKNGEKTMRCASSSPVRPKLAPKPAPGKKDQYKSIYQNSFDVSSLDRTQDAARLHLRLHDDDIYLTAPSVEAHELWKGFILSVVKLQVPTSLNLLPGQVHMLREAVAKENERLKEIAEKAAVEQASKAAATPDTNDYMAVLSEMPECFCKLSRIETEFLLEKHKDKGNLLLRPSRDGTCFAVTTRQEFNGPVFQHYRVTRIPDGGFAIAVENPITCKTLQDVINYLIETTGGTYKPLVLEHTYEENIVYVDYDEENGEKSMRSASSSPVRPNLAPKPARPLTPQGSPPYLPKGPGGALLPPNSRPCSPIVGAEAKTKRTMPEVPTGETLSQLYVDYDEENGEKSMRSASSSPVRPNLAPKPAPRKKRDHHESIYQNSSEEEDCCLVDEDECAPPPLLPRAPVRALVHQSSVPDLQIGPGGALLPPNSRPRSATVVAEAKPKGPIPAVPIGETLSQ
ncbi:signal-transducing adaptor protein 2, partial [Clarias magur]